MLEGVQIKLTRKGGDIVVGDRDAPLVVTVPFEEALTDPCVTFMRGTLKTTGQLASVLDLLQSGALAEALAEAVSSVTAD